MKKIFSLLFVGAVIVLLAGCSLSQSSTSFFKTEENLLGFSAVSTVKTLSGVFVSEETLSLSTETVENKPTITEVEPYLAMLESIKQDQGFNVVESESDNELYQSMMEISLKDIDGSVRVYKFYFNEEVLDEESVNITGLMVIGGVDYYLEGFKETEIDDDEDEIEYKLELKASVDEFNYCLLEYEVETETTELEKEFNYEVYQDNILVKAVNISFEAEDNETEISLEFIEGNNSRKYKFEQEDNEIEVVYEVKENDQIISQGKALLTISVDPLTGKDVITYAVDDDLDDDYEEEFESDYEKDDDEDDDEEEDDDDEEIEQA